ncbi:tRNA dimethylallyltransferase (Isopentenyl-diphosphate:tRNA isopentenyltransferase) (IPP transferase) (IPPT) (hGRO1) (tRNA isopentenyltransferase 1) (IPTase) [Durusdinium trenchii]|uniref:tRNA dimethylallyltransferase (Isopentenyl-diphosphate:tRNA isopentenyltransferase) (IPP transferase) (IPPT) (HGRO1) (tRNA isopentenyltransferase 1) (IPTase) n=1 Tax=Durusdinium trenchii TaxID=1381693 RepID=A0ABP0LPD6_9DINO
MKRKVVVVVGATGTGKSKLGIELAKRFDGEVVNADAMQMYKGMDIACAKVTEEEMDGVRHHLLSVLEPTERWDVRTFRDAALPVIEDIASRGKLPILVGGTLYYVQTLLWGSLADESPSFKRTQGKKDAVHLGNVDDHIPEGVSDWDFLNQIDPEAAKAFHPNDSRKIRNAIMVFLNTGAKQSDLMKEQKQTGMQDDPRFDARVLWLKCDKKKLWPRLQKRVERMILDGMLQETYDFHKAHPMDKATGGSGADVSGIYQAMGFNEFRSFFDAVDEQAALSRPSTPMVRVDGETGRIEIVPRLALQHPECRKGMERLFIKHRQYTGKQIQWINNKLRTRGVPVHDLDASSVTAWATKVHEPATEICAWLLQKDHTADKDPPGLPRCNKTRDENCKAQELVRYDCALCGISTVGSISWQSHLNSRSHMRAVKRAAAVGAAPAENVTAPSTSVASATSVSTSPLKKRQRSNDPGVIEFAKLVEGIEAAERQESGNGK